MMSKKEICIAHSPDSDDAFMFYALATGKVESDEFRFIHELHDIETLNQAASSGKYEVTAISIHAYAHLYDQYALLNSGASMGEGYGPIVVSATQINPDELAGHVVGIPGKQTSAYLALQLFEPDLEFRVIPFDQIMSSVQQRKVDAGVIIHEGQLTYREDGLHKVVDLGEWWSDVNGLPLPLGGNVIRRDLGEKDICKISHLIRESISYALSHREEALSYALEFGRGLSPEQGDRFVQMYVNNRTLDYGEKGREAVQLFLDYGYKKGLIPNQIQVDFV